MTPPPRLVLVPQSFVDAAKRVVDDAHGIHDREPWPQKYTAPYGALVVLQAEIHMLSSTPEAPSEKDVERVARALCRAIGVPEDGLIADSRSAHDLANRRPCWQHQLPKARATIAALLAGPR